MLFHLSQRPRTFVSRTRGFSMVELLVVMSILGVLVTIGAGTLRSDRLAVNQAAEGLASQIARARLEAIRRNSFVGVCFDTSGNGSYTVRSAETAAEVCPEGTSIQHVALGSGDWAKVKLGTLNLSSSFDGVVFNSLGLTTGNVNGTFTVQNSEGSYTKNVVVNGQGRASVQ